MDGTAIKQAPAKQSKAGKPNKALNIALRTLVSFIGVCAIAIGAGFLKESGQGLDPFTALNIGMSKHFGLSLGTYQLAINLVIFVVILVLDRHQIGIGTFFNMILVGFGIQWFTTFYQAHVIEANTHLAVIGINLILGIAFFTLGTSLYMEANLGVAPYDAIAPIIVKKTKLKYQWVRATQDILFMVAGVLAGGAVGIMTILLAFCAGPLIGAWNKTVSFRIIKHIDNFSHAQKKIKHVSAGLAGAGKTSWSFVRNIFRETNLMEQNMSTYSDNQLFDALDVANENIQSETMTIQNLKSRKASIQHELDKRKSMKQSKKAA